MFDRVWVVFCKEVIDNMRDRRSVSLALLYPFLGPLVVAALIVFVGKSITSAPTDTFILPVQGEANAPELIEYITTKGALVVPAPSDPALAVRTGKFDTALIISDDYGENFDRERQATVHLVVDGSRLSAVVAMSRALDALRDYNRDIGTARLEARGLDPNLSVPLAIEQINVSGGRNLTGFFLNMMPPFLIFTIFVGGVYLAIDTTSGERERGSMEPLLTNPVARWELMVAKVAATFMFTAMAVAVQLVAFKVMFNLITGGDFGLRVDLGFWLFASVFLICLPLMLFAVTLQVIIATVTRSFKETQTYLGLLPLVPSLPGLVLVFVAINAHPWMMAIPTFGQTLLIGQMVRGEPLTGLSIVVASGFTLAASLGLLALAARLYARDELVFTG